MRIKSFKECYLKWDGQRRYSRQKNSKCKRPRLRMLLEPESSDKVEGLGGEAGALQDYTCLK